MTQFRLHCVVCENSIDYFKYLLKNYRDLASPTAEISVYAHCTDDKSYQMVQDQKLANYFFPVHRQPQHYVYANRHDVFNLFKLYLGGSPKLGGSSGHAAGLNSFFKHCGSDGIDIIADTDTLIVVKNWDLVLSNILSQKDMIATKYENKGGTSSGASETQTYKDRPNLTWAAISSRVSLAELDAGHMLSKNLQIKSKEQADIFGLNVGNFLHRDVGWKLPQYIFDHKISYVVFENLYPESGLCKVLKHKNSYNEEYQLDGVPFIVHQRGSRKHPFRSEPLSAPFYNAADDYIQNMVDKKS